MPPAAQPTPRTVRAALAYSLAVDAFTVDAVDALECAGMKPLLLKGPALAELLYEPGEERAWDDADVLVAPDDREGALAALGAIGFESQEKSAVMRARVPQETHLVRRPEHPVPFGPAMEMVDLHHSFAGVEGDPHAFWSSLEADRDAVELFDRRVEVPSVPARLALVALHAACHGRPVERPLRDLRRAVSRYGDDLETFAAAAALAVRWEALDYFVAGLRLDAEGARLVAALGIEHEPSRAATMHAAGMSSAQVGIEHLARVQGVGPRLRLVAIKLFPSPAVMRRWRPIARRGPLGLAAAYVWRAAWLPAQLVLAVPPYIRALRR